MCTMDIGCIAQFIFHLHKDRYSNMDCDFLWEATLPHHILVFNGAESTATPSSWENIQAS